jgi:serine/threonine protein kinase
VNGLVYLHSLGIVHGDLKGVRPLHECLHVSYDCQPNILICDSYRACLADFGLTTIDLDTIHTYSTTSTTIGSVQWMAPELFDPDQYGLYKSVPSRESDIYALGIVIYEVLNVLCRILF